MPEISEGEKLRVRCEKLRVMGERLKVKGRKGYRRLQNLAAIVASGIPRNHTSLFCVYIFLYSTHTSYDGNVRERENSKS